MTHVEEKVHARLGPSGWDTWGTCPGSDPLSEGMPNNSSKYARLGTAAHQLLEDCILGELDAVDLMGKEYVVEGEAYIVDLNMADAVDAALAYIRDTIQPGRGDILMAEQSVPIQHITGEEGAEGTSDVVGIVDGGKTLVVMDYKHGQGVKVWASNKDGTPNGQLAIYAMGTLHKFGFMYEEIERVRLVVLQPRQEHIDEFVISVTDLMAFGYDVAEAAGRVELNRLAQVNGDPLDLNPSEKGCKFCKAKTRCPALKQLTVAAMAPASDENDFEDLSLPKKAASLVVSEYLTADQLAEIMRAAPLIEDYLKAIRGEVDRRLMSGESVPGFYVGEGKKGNRAWRDAEEASDELTKSGRLSAKEAWKRTPITPTQAETLLKARPKIWSKIAPLITQSAGKPSVCREGIDSNPVYKIASPIEAFDDLTAAPAVEIDDPMAM